MTDAFDMAGAIAAERLAFEPAARMHQFLFISVSIGLRCIVC